MIERLRRALELVDALPPDVQEDLAEHIVQRRKALRALLRGVRPLPSTYGVLERYADLRRAMRPPHGPG
jgi:hypothetical protein